MTKMFHKIGEVSKMTGVDAATLRYWEKEFAVLKPQKTRSGQRIYTQRDLELVLKIRKLLHDDGYTVSGARKWLSGPSAGVEETSEGRGPGTDGRRANRLQQARQLTREILDILETQKTSE